MRVLLILILILSLSNCKSGSDARKIPPNVKDRQLKNIEEGRGFRLTGNKKNTGEFDFASSNELWRASLDTLEFMPLALANYSGGILVTDWYSNDDNNRESIKISIRFLSNEIRSDAVDINVFYKKCDADFKCVVQKNNKNIETELRREILKKATIYQKQTRAKNKSYYPTPKMGGEAN